MWFSSPLSMSSPTSPPFIYGPYIQTKQLLPLYHIDSKTAKNNKTARGLAKDLACIQVKLLCFFHVCDCVCVYLYVFTCSSIYGIKMNGNCLLFNGQRITWINSFLHLASKLGTNYTPIDGG